MRREHTKHMPYTIGYFMHGARNIGGGEKALFQEIAYLDRNKFLPILFFAQDNGLIMQIKASGVKTIKVDLDPRLLAVERKKFFHGAWLFLAFIKAGFKITKALKERRVDLYHPHDNFSKLSSAWLAKLAGIKVVTHCHDLLGKSLIDKVLRIYQLLFMDKIIAVSAQAQEVFKVFNRIPKKVVKIYNSIDKERFNADKTQALTRESLEIKDKEALVIAIVGFLYYCKGHEYLFKALKDIIQKDKRRVVCLVVGGGNLDKELKAKAAALGIESSVVFLGHRDDVNLILKSVDILAMPSIQESFGLAAVEAMATGVPVVASDVGGLKEIIVDGKTGFLVPPADAKRLTEALKKLIDDKDLRSAMGEAARSSAQRWVDVAENIRRTETEYLSVFK